MITAECPTDEVERLAALRSYDLLDTEPEAVFDRLTTEAARVAETPIALITLVDTDRQWFKSVRGLSVRETPRDVAFCAHAILGNGPLIVESTVDDERFWDNPLVTGEPHIGFYAGFPLVGPDGHGLGTLCVIDVEPRQLTTDQLDALHALTQEVIAQMRARRAMLRAARLERPATGSERRGPSSDAAPHRPGPPRSHDEVYDLAVAMRPIPASISQLAAAVGDPNVELGDVVSIVESDPVLVGSLIRQANSAASAPRTEITTVSRAIAYLGFAATLAAATASGIGPRAQAPLPAYDLQVGELWGHAIAAADIAAQLHRLAPSKLDPGVATAALLHDLGQVLLDEVLNPSIFRQLVDHGTTVENAERETIDLDHAEVGALILELWQLPSLIVEAVRYHHEPSMSERFEAHAVAIANHLATSPDASADLEADPALAASLAALDLTPAQVVELSPAAHA